MGVTLSDGVNSITVELTELSPGFSRESTRIPTTSGAVYVPIGYTETITISFTIYNSTDLNTLLTILNNVFSGVNTLQVTASTIPELPVGTYYADKCTIKAVVGAPNVRDVRLTLYPKVY